MKPKRIQRISATELNVVWHDGHTGRYTMRRLRDECPCAVCRAGKTEGDGVLLPIFDEKKYILRGINLVGTYAVQLSWEDGHNTGIYRYEYLRSLCECGECAESV